MIFKIPYGHACSSMDSIYLLKFLNSLSDGLKTGHSRTNLLF
jgi:hypothetical protein